MNNIAQQVEKIGVVGLLTLALAGCSGLSSTSQSKIGNNPLTTQQPIGILGGLQSYLDTMKADAQNGDVAAKKTYAQQFAATDQQAYDWLLQNAQKGDNSAQLQLAQLYEAGSATAKTNPQQAFKWYMKAAEHGNMSARSKLARLYANGEGVTRDLSKAAYYDRLAAQQGSAISQNNLASSYARGLGVKQDVKKAVFWYEKSAKQGYPIAQYNLATAYQSGFGVNQNAGVAYAWYATVASQANSLQKVARQLAQQMLIETQKTGRTAAAKQLASSYIAHYSH